MGEGRILEEEIVLLMSHGKQFKLTLPGKVSNFSSFIVSGPASLVHSQPGCSGRQKCPARVPQLSSHCRHPDWYSHHLSDYCPTLAQHPSAQWSLYSRVVAALSARSFAWTSLHRRAAITQQDVVQRGQMQKQTGKHRIYMNV